MRSNKSDNISNYNFSIYNTKVYYSGDGIFVFDNDSNQIEFNFTDDYLTIDNNITLKGIINNISSADAEHVFIKYYFLSFFLFMAGCYIILYGAEHNTFSLIVHLFFFSYFFIGDIISFITNFEKYILYLFFALLLISITISILLKFKKENVEKNSETLKGIDTSSFKFLKKHWINGIYGATFGFSILKTLLYYMIGFGVPFNFNRESKFVLYLSLLIIVVVISAILYLFDIFKQYRYLICSAFAGSFYIVKSIEYIIGGYFSSILFYYYDLEFKNFKNREDGKRDMEIILTYFFFHILTIIFSIIFQLRYLKWLENAIPNIEESGRNSLTNPSPRITRASNPIYENNQTDEKGENVYLLPNKNFEENSVNDYEDINDQED